LLPGRRFVDLLDLNRQATEWRDEFANHRVHEATGKVPALVFENEERMLLKLLSAETFDTDDREPTGVTKCDAFAWIATRTRCRGDWSASPCSLRAMTARRGK
jgi:hypothetical protein